MPWWQFFSNCLTKKDIIPWPFAAAGAGRERGRMKTHSMTLMLSCISAAANSGQPSIHTIQNALTRIYDAQFCYFYLPVIRFSIPCAVYSEWCIIFRERCHWMSQIALTCCHLLVIWIFWMYDISVTFPFRVYISSTIWKSNRKSWALHGSFTDTKMMWQHTGH